LARFTAYARGERLADASLWPRRTSGRSTDGSTTSHFAGARHTIADDRFETPKLGATFEHENVNAARAITR
jgi:hypothetical protein